MEIQNYIKKPQTLSRDTLDELRDLVERYPYYETARMLLLKNMYLLHDEDFSKELASSSLYLNNSKALFYLLEGENYEIETKDRILEEEQTEEESDRTLSLIDKFLGQLPEDRRPSVSASAVNPAVDYASYLMAQEEDAGKRISLPALEQEEEAEPQQAVLMPEYDIQDTVTISESDASDEPLEESVSVSEEPLGDCVTEAMARIFIKQKSYSKALQIIRQLNLKNPEKNAYFADQMRFLEKLIIITNKQR